MGSRSMRLNVLLFALLLATVALAGCHDLFDDDPSPDGGDGTGDNGNGNGDNGNGDNDNDNGNGNGDNGNDNGNGDNGNGDNGNGDNGNGDNGNGDNGNGNGDNGNGDNGNGNGDDPPPSFEVGSFTPDHVLRIERGDACNSDEFTPASFTINAGESVAWEHDGHGDEGPPCPHNVKIEGEDARTEFVGHGETTESIRFNEPGTYGYFCQAHPGMTGEIVVS